MAIENYKKVFIVGIKGVAMANLAVILKQMGKEVCGSDVSEEFITDVVLKSHKIQVVENFSLDSLPEKTDLVIYSAAHKGTDNPQIVEAISRGIAVKSQAKLLDEIMQTFPNSIAVSGCHGKTTTASILTHTLKKLKAHPSYLIGTPFFGKEEGSNFQKSEYFVVEADEYGINPPKDKKPKFHLLKPSYILCTNIDFDHPDVYKNLEETKKAFLEFFSPLKHFNGVRLVICTDDENTMDVVKVLPREMYTTYGFSENSDWQIVDPKINELSSKFSLLYEGKPYGEFEISLFGLKNISNATGVVVMLHILGFKQVEIALVIKGFIGAERRFEQKAYINNIYIFDDYAHHPNEIQATIHAAKERFPERRIIVIFQPHTYSRTEKLKKEFVAALVEADYSFVLPIFPSARENPEEFSVTSKDLEKEAVKIHKNNLKSIENEDQLVEEIQKIVKPSDVIFTMGAGDVYKLEKNLIKILSVK